MIKAHEYCQQLYPCPKRTEQIALRNVRCLNIKDGASQSFIKGTHCSAEIASAFKYLMGHNRMSIPHVGFVVHSMHWRGHSASWVPNDNCVAFLFESPKLGREQRKADA